MKRIFLGTLLCFILSVGMYHLGVFHFSWDYVSTLYTIVGIVFSVGMSLIISVSTREVKNREAKKSLEVANCDFKCGTCSAEAWANG